MRSRDRTRVLVSAALLCGANVAAAQAYPTKTIRILASDPGAASDISSRLIGQGIAPVLGKPIIVENHPGILSVEAAAKANPDGHTLLLYGSLVWLLPLMRDHVSWDPKQFIPVTMTTTAPNLVVVYPPLPVKSVKELIAFAKAKPGELLYSVGQRGAQTHLAVELFKAMSGVDIKGVPYKGNVPGLNALLSGEVQLLFATSGSGGPHVKAGRVRALAVTSAEPSALFPDLPTVAAAGLPGYESVTILGILVPANTPEPIVKRLNREIVEFIRNTEIKEKFFATGAEVVGSTAEEFARQIRNEVTTYGKVIKQFNIRAD